AVFSSNADPFEGPSGGKPCTCYCRFAVYTFLNHGGDFKAAAQALYEQGYGTRREEKKGSGQQGEPAPDDLDLSPLRLRLASARRTPSGKVVAELVVLRQGQAIDQFTLSSALSARQGAVKQLLQHLGADDAGSAGRVETALGRLVTRAAELASKP